MKSQAPNPEVYRRAAELVDYSESYLEAYNRFSCMAIERAMNELGIRDQRRRRMHDAQYQAMFGPYVNPKVLTFPGGACVDFDRVRDGHPYWNAGHSEEAQDKRVIALLLMAEICEQGI